MRVRVRVRVRASVRVRVRVPVLALKPADNVRLATHAHARAGVAAREGGLERGLDTHTRTHSGQG